MQTDHAESYLPIADAPGYLPIAMHGRHRHERRRRAGAGRDDASASGLTVLRFAAGRGPAGWLWPLGALVCAGAVLSVLVLQVSEVFCDERCQARSWALSWQLLAAVAGLIATGAMTVFAASGNRRVALAFLLVAVGLLCAVVVDVAQDGLGDTAFAL